MLIRRAELEAIREGRIRLAFRYWKRPTVKAGGSLRTALGVLAIQTVDRVDPSRVTDADAEAAGHADLAALRSALPRRPDADLYRIELRWAGPDPRTALRERCDLSPPELAELEVRLGRLDRARRDGPWTRAVLELIGGAPATRAPELAARLGRPTAAFKRDVRKLKDLGLTESLAVGYQLSPRGRALLESLSGTREDS